MSSRSSPKSPKTARSSVRSAFDPTFALLIVFAVAVIAVVYFVWTSDDIKTVTQATNKTTAVTVNGQKGVITTVALVDAADTEFEFTVTNSSVRADSLILLTPEYNGTGAVALQIKSVAAGSFIVKVRNVGTAVLNAVSKIHFRIY